jgi:D-glutamate cyclase
MPETIGEYVDRLCTVEMRPGKGNLPRGVIHRLYDAAREQAGGGPLTLNMAQAMVDRVKPGDAVFILTGAGGPPVLPKAEVDGLLGAAALARALHFALGAVPYILTEERAAEPVRAACWGASLNFRREGEDETSHQVTFIPMSLDDDACKKQAPELLDRLKPALVVGIEKLAPNRSGVIHGATGLDYTDVHANPKYLFDGARERGILTAGIGDGGNECGFGVVEEAVREIMPAGDKCECPCGNGSAASVATDTFLVAAISNWGGYGVAAMVCFLHGDLEPLIDADDLERMLRDVVGAGAFDGGTGRPTVSDDGVLLRAQRAFIDMLRSIVTIGQVDLASPGH